MTIRGLAFDPSTGHLHLGSAQGLVELTTHTNEWFVRQARLQLIERATKLAEVAVATKELHVRFAFEMDPVQQLRALWSLHSLGLGRDAFYLTQLLLLRSDEHIRAWAVRLLTDTWPIDTVMSTRPRNQTESVGETDAFGRANILRTELIRLARQDRSALVRMALASALQRLPVNLRSELAAALVAHKEDADDHNLPALIWYGLIPLAESRPSDMTTIVNLCELPLTRRLIARRLAESIGPIPTFYLTVDIDLSRAAEMRAAFESLELSFVGIFTVLKVVVVHVVLESLKRCLNGSRPSGVCRDSLKGVNHVISGCSF